MDVISVVDSHTGGEPTRVVLSGGPDLGAGPLADRVARFRAELDRYRSAIVNEPRGSDVMVGAIVVPPHDERCSLGVIFFNNVGYLGMCGHGTIGLVATLAARGQLQPGRHLIDTCVGSVTATLHDDGSVSVANVTSWRQAADVEVAVPGIGTVRGDVAWGGNWFFLVDSHGQSLTRGNIESLTDYAWRVRQAVNAQGFPDVDHVELFGPSECAAALPASATGSKAASPKAHSRNFVLCPGKAYDRSPCGTGTSAKLACLAADGKLAEHEVWIQESIIGSRFAAQFTWEDRATGRIAPVVRGEAHITGEAKLLLDDRDPYCWGILS